MLLIAALLIGFTTGSTPVDLITAVPLQDWRVETGDSFFVDTKENVGYLLHTDGVFTQFPVATGQRRTVRYIGRTYNATTPERDWVATSLELKQYDTVTFGPTGRFFRLTSKNERTPYGIHGHRDSAVMLLQDIRFESMGCIIVSEEVLDIIEQTYSANSQSLRVVTRYGLARGSIAMN